MSATTAYEIGIVHYPGAQVACILGLTDLFGVASRIARDQQRSGQSALRVTHWRPLHSGDANLSCVFDSAPRGSPKPRTLDDPPTMVDLPDPDVPAGVVSWLRNRHAVGATLVSLCSGAFILAETGLVDGKVGCHPSDLRRGSHETFSTNRGRCESAHYRSWRHRHCGRISRHGSILACFSLTGFLART